MGRTALKAAALLLLLGLSAAAWPANDDESPEAKLARWLKSKGAKLKGIKVERDCPTCKPRVVATKNFKADDVILKIPFSAAFKFEEQSAFPAEHARELLDKQVNVPSFNETYGTFWATQPGPDQVFTPELYTEEMLDMLQAKELRALVERQLSVTLGVWQGDPTEPPFPGVPEISKGVTMDRFKYVSGLVHSRSFAFYCDESDAELCTFLTPLLDTVAHSDNANSERSGDGKKIVLTATRAIQKGEEITQNYFPNVVHRPDMSLYYYGFVTEREVPLLPAVDLPRFRSQDPFAETPQDDAMYDDPKGEHVTKREYERLSKRLAAAGTTLEEDEALLEGGTVTDWRQQVILKFRIHRKRALKLNIEKIARHLGLSEEEKEVEAAQLAAEEAGEEEAKDEL